MLVEDQCPEGGVHQLLELLEDGVQLDLLDEGGQEAGVEGDGLVQLLHGAHVVAQLLLDLGADDQHIGFAPKVMTKPSITKKNCYQYLQAGKGVQVLLEKLVRRVGDGVVDDEPAEEDIALKEGKRERK